MELCKHAMAQCWQLSRALPGNQRAAASRLQQNLDMFGMCIEFVAYRCRGKPEYMLAEGTRKIAVPWLHLQFEMVSVYAVGKTRCNMELVDLLVFQAQERKPGQSPALSQVIAGPIFFCMSMIEAGASA